MTRILRLFSQYRLLEKRVIELEDEIVSERGKRLDLALTAAYLALPTFRNDPVYRDPASGEPPPGMIS